MFKPKRATPDTPKPQLGLRYDANPVEIGWPYAPHALISGVTGSGKSSWVSMYIAMAAAYRNTATLELPRHPDGRRNRKLRRARTQTEAKRKLIVMRKEFETNGLVSSKNRMVVDTIGEHLTNRLASNVERKTLERDKLFARRMSAFLSNRKTSELTVTDCDRLFEAYATGELTAAGEPPTKKYIVRARAFLKNALTNDMRLGYINRNVAELAIVPETNVESRQRRSLTIDEWNLLYGTASGMPELIIDFGGRHGLRPQEIRSTSWSDIDFDNRTLSILTQQSSYDEQVDPKTNNSTRTIGLHRETIDSLRSWQIQQAELGLKAGPAWSDTGLVVTTSRGTPIQRGRQGELLHKVCNNSGVERITPYELRHTAISQQIEAGHNLTQVADWAGTSVKMIQQHYRHKLQEISVIPPVDMTQAESA